ncbi:MAG: cation:proton antiporter [Thermomicrobiales bacterium]
MLWQTELSEQLVIDSVRAFAWLLLGAAIIGVAARRLGVPYAVSLVVGGLLVEETHLIAVPTIDPAVVLFAFLPPLLFDAAFRLDARELRIVARPVLLLAVPGVFITALVVGGLVALALGLPLPVALLFGSIVAATDPVAVIALLRELALPARLVIIPEAESLVNDGMAIALFTALSGLAVTGVVDLPALGMLLVREALLGLAVGAALAFVFSRLTATIDDHLIEMMLSVVLAYGSYLIADGLHASGPLACVAAGIVQGTYGREFGMSEQSSRLLDDLWEFLGFFANALLFLLVGLSVNLAELLANAGAVAVAVVAVVTARVLVVEGMGLVTRGGPLAAPFRERVVLMWSGLRGALTIALALGLPLATPSRDLLINMAFGVVLFTLIVQGLTIPVVVRRFGFQRPEDAVGHA